MNKKYIYRAAAFMCTLLAFVHMWSCSEDENLVNGDSTPPGKVSNVEFTAVNGGGLFTYDLPSDEDILMVKAVYSLDNGDEIYKVASFYTDSLFIEGLGTVKEYPIKIITVDRSGNESEPHVEKVTPLEPSTHAVQKTIQIFPSFSGVLLSWENEMEQPLTIFVNFNVEGKEVVKVYSSNLARDNFAIMGLGASPYPFSAYVKDSYGNVSEVKELGDVTPYEDYELDKSSWTFLRDELLPDEMNESWVEYDEENDEHTPMSRTLTRGEKGGFDGGWNAKPSHYEGRIEKIWDNEYDNAELLNLNYFHTGQQSYPFSYYIDLGRTVKASRFRVWQRDWSGQFYGGENVKEFELWISDDKVNWERVRNATIIKPSDTNVALNEAREGHHFIIYVDEPRFTKPFRYLEYRAIKPFNSWVTSGCTSELTVYGVDGN